MSKSRETVLYGMYGICEVTGIEEKEIVGRRADYYVLRPVYDNKTSIFLPVNNESAAKMRPVLSPDEVYALIRAMPDETTIHIENESENERKVRYKAILAEGNRTELVRLIKTLHFQCQERIVSGKKPRLFDKNFMQAAEKLLYEEFAHVLNIEKDRVLGLITRIISSPQ